MDSRFRESLVELMNQKGIDAMMISPSQELRFLAGFTVYLDERFQAMVLTDKGEAFYICNLLSRDEVAEQTKLPMEIYTWTDNEDFAEKTKEVLEKYNLLGKTIGVNTTVPAYHVLGLAQKLGVRFVDGTKWLEEIRIIKTHEEREKLRKAAKITDDIFPQILSFIHPGIREIDVRTRMEQLFAEKGVKLAGDIVASGSNSALPHYFGNQRVIGEQDVIVLDYGCNYQGIFSDMTRTVFVGGITSHQEKVYGIVKRALEAAKKEAVLGGSGPGWGTLPPVFTLPQPTPPNLPSHPCALLQLFQAVECVHDGGSWDDGAVLFEQVAVAGLDSLAEGGKQFLGAGFLIGNQAHGSKLHLQVGSVVRYAVLLLLGWDKTPEGAVGAVSVDNGLGFFGFFVEGQMEGPLFAGLFAAQRLAVQGNGGEILRLHGAKASAAGADIDVILVAKAHVGGRPRCFPAVKKAVADPHRLFKLFL